MSLDLSDTLVVGISATALFDLTEANAVFRAKFESDKETAVAEYRGVHADARERTAQRRNGDAPG